MVKEIVLTVTDLTKGIPVNNTTMDSILLLKISINMMAKK